MMYKLIAHTSTNWHLFSVAQICRYICSHVKAGRLYKVVFSTADVTYDFAADSRAGSGENLVTTC